MCDDQDQIYFAYSSMNTNIYAVLLSYAFLLHLFHFYNFRYVQNFYSQTYWKRLQNT